MPLANGIVPAVGLQGLRAKSEAPNKSSVACEGILSRCRISWSCSFESLCKTDHMPHPGSAAPPPPVFLDLYIAAFRALSGPNPKISTLEPSSRTLL